MECGFKDEGYLHPIREHVFINEDGEVDSGAESHGDTNITAQFREFLDKDKGMKQFTKNDLKNGDELYLSDCPDPELPHYICGTSACQDRNYSPRWGDLRNLKDDLTFTNGKKLLKVVRDGTVLFEREPELKEVTLKLTQEQIDSLKEQGIG